MRPHGALPEATAADITPAVLAIGRPHFSQALIATLRRLADVGHCMVFSFTPQGSARCLLDIGNIPVGGYLGVAYSEHFHAADPNRDAILAGEDAVAPIVLPTFAPRMYSDAYRKIFFDDSGIVDKFAAAIWVDRACFYVNFYRTRSQGRFGSGELRCLKQIAPTVSAAVARHFQEDGVSNPDPGDRIEAMIATGEPFAALTGREKQVCRHILSGLSSEAISAELGISLHSTLTYRKRAYEKLGISCQNELFGMMLRLLTATPKLN
ncbi:helix-turn-helix transcriptional regulator [Bradyrhizobium sp. STM 3562]|uniref:helix-turn-helix transcriptional regulator n=1 Tax=Bradyrhizobium sp. STM 3562 TaxID=578924 RepID=UPI00388F835F